MATRLSRRWALAVAAVAVIVATGAIGVHWRGAQTAPATATSVATASGVAIGSPNAKVAMEIYSDFR